MAKNSKKTPAAKKSTLEKVAKHNAEVAAGTRSGPTIVKVNGRPVKAPRKAPAVTNKLLIRDACATPGCIKEPQAGSSYCPEHHAVEQAKAAVADPIVQRELTKLIQGEAKTNAKAAKKAPQKTTVEVSVDAGVRPPLPSSSNAVEVIHALRSMGWSDIKMSAAIGNKGTDPQLSHFIWKIRKLGKPCSPEHLAALQSLLSVPAPAGKAVSKTVKKHAQAAYRARAAQPRWADPRQLFLDLRDALNNVLDATK